MRTRCGTFNSLSSLAGEPWPPSAGAAEQLDHRSEQPVPVQNRVHAILDARLQLHQRDAITQPLTLLPDIHRRQPHFPQPGRLEAQQTQQVGVGAGRYL